jgi:hypothetical protein
VPIGPCVVISMERMRNMRELDAAAGTVTVEAEVVMEAVQRAADAVDLLFPSTSEVAARSRLAVVLPPTRVAIVCCGLAWRAIWCSAWRQSLPTVPSLTLCER